MEWPLLTWIVGYFPAAIIITVYAIRLMQLNENDKGELFLGSIIGFVSAFVWPLLIIIGFGGALVYWTLRRLLNWL